MIMNVSLRTLSFLALPFSLLTHASEYPEVFIGLKGGYQWAFDETYQHSAPNGPMLGIYTGLEFFPAWSWDLGYQYHDDLEADVTSITVNAQLVESALRYDWQVEANFGVYGRLGAVYWDMNKTLRSSKKLDADGFSLLSEVGMSYDFNPNLNLSVGYQYIDGIGNSNTGQYDSHGVMFGLGYTFGKKVQTIELSPEA